MACPFWGWAGSGAGGQQGGRAAGRASGSKQMACFIARCNALQVATVKVAIEEEHKARWDEAECKVRRPKAGTGEIGYREAAAERVAALWPELKHLVLPSAITNLKASLWKGGLGISGIWTAWRSPCMLRWALC